MGPMHWKGFLQAEATGLHRASFSGALSSRTSGQFSNQRPSGIPQPVVVAFATYGAVGPVHFEQGEAQT